MSELKERLLGQTMNEYGCDTKIYLKSEADKVIAELKSERDGAMGLQLIGMTLEDYQAASDKLLNHQKYKRCLAMAKWCFTKSNYHFVLARHGEDAKKNSRKSELYAKWHKRWLTLADKYKEGNV